MAQPLNTSADRLITKLLGAASAVLLLSAVLWSAPQATFEIAGRVVNAITHEPIRGVIVAIHVATGPGEEDRYIGFLTDADGRFRFVDLPAGAADISATKVGWVSGTDASDRRSIDIAANPARALDPLELSLVPEARLEGRVVDQSGLPLANEAVGISRAGQSVSDQPLRTDDEGTFTVGALLAGEYEIDGLEPAGPVKVATGEVRSGLIIRSQSGLLVATPGSRPTISPSDTPKISGIVVDASGHAVRSAQVMMIGPIRANGISGNGSHADETGRFEFKLNAGPLGSTRPLALSPLEGGDFVIFAAPTSAGMTSPALLRLSDTALKGVLPPETIHLEKGEQAENVVVTIPHGGVITGRVTDAAGDPIAASVSAIELSAPAVGHPFFQSAPTNTTGRYRIAGLEPGMYQVAVEALNYPADLHAPDASGADRRVALLRTFFPDVPTTLAALPIGVGPEAFVDGIDLHVAPTPISKIELHATASQDLIGTLQVEVRSLDDPGAAWRIVRSDSSHTQDVVPVDQLPAGNYTIAVEGHVTEPPSDVWIGVWGWVQTATDGVTPQRTEVLLSGGASVRGRVVFDGTNGIPSEARLVLAHWSPADVPVEWATATVSLEPNAEFMIRDLPPTRYRLTASASQWLIRSVTLEGRDVLGAPIDLTSGVDANDLVLTFTDRVGTIIGSVSGPTSGASRVAVFPTDRRLWTTLTRVQTLPVTNGKYTSGPMVAGDYLVAALETADLTDIPALLDRIAALATRVTVGEGEQHTQNLVAR